LAWVLERPATRYGNLFSKFTPQDSHSLPLQYDESSEDPEGFRASLCENDLEKLVVGTWVFIQN